MKSTDGSISGKREDELNDPWWCRKNYGGVPE